MNPSLPAVLSLLMHSYNDCLRPLLGANLTGIYLHGSIALGAFDERTSDIDFVTVTQRSLSRKEERAVRTLHRQLRRERWGRRMDGVYVPRIALQRVDAARFLHVHHGRLSSGTERLPVAARVLLHGWGVVVDGPPAHEVFPAISSALLRDEMLFNLNSYWAERLRSPWLFLSEEMADFAVTTLPRIIHTLEQGSIISKQQGLGLLRERFPEWRVLVDATISPSRYRIISLTRARSVVAFVRAMIDHGNALHNSSPSR